MIGLSCRRGTRTFAMACAVLLFAAGTGQGIAPTRAATEPPALEASLPADLLPPLEAGPLRYRGAWGGLYVADVTLTLRGDSQAYWGDMNINTRGLLGWAFDWMGTLHARGALNGEADLSPTVFERRFVQSDDSGAVIIEYDSTGLAQGFEDGEPQTAIAPHLRQDTVDPLAALIGLRQHVLSGHSGMVTMPVFDGKRRIDVVATIEPQRVTRIGGTDHQVVPVIASITPVAGFKPKQARGWASSHLRVLFTADDQALPLRIQVESPVGTAVLTLR